MKEKFRIKLIKNRKIQIHKSNSQEKAKISVKVKPKKKRRTSSMKKSINATIKQQIIITTLTIS